MTTLLHIDSSVRLQSSEHHIYGSHTRRLTASFVAERLKYHPDMQVIYRDLALNPPSLMTEQWVHAAFTPPHLRETWMNEILMESDALISELMSADMIVIGCPMYNFGPSAHLKAYIDQIVRVGVTFGFDRTRGDPPFWPMIPAHKKLILITSSGDYGYWNSGHNATRNHTATLISDIFNYLGVNDTEVIAVEYDEFADERVTQSILNAEKTLIELAGQ